MSSGKMAISAMGTVAVVYVITTRPNAYKRAAEATLNIKSSRVHRQAAATDEPEDFPVPDCIYDQYHKEFPDGHHADCGKLKSIDDRECDKGIKDVLKGYVASVCDAESAPVPSTPPGEDCEEFGAGAEFCEAGEPILDEPSCKNAAHCVAIKYWGLIPNSPEIKKEDYPRGCYELLDPASPLKGIWFNDYPSGVSAKNERRLVCRQVYDPTRAVVANSAYDNKICGSNNEPLRSFRWFGDGGDFNQGEGQADLDKCRKTCSNLIDCAWMSVFDGPDKFWCIGCKAEGPVTELTGSSIAGYFKAEVNCADKVEAPAAITAPLYGKTHDEFGVKNAGSSWKDRWDDHHWCVLVSLKDGEKCSDYKGYTCDLRNGLWNSPDFTDETCTNVWWPCEDETQPDKKETRDCTSPTHGDTQSRKGSCQASHQ